MDPRLYPVSPAYFDQYILPLIEGSYIWQGRPPTISHYQVFCAILYVLRTGCPGATCPPVTANGIRSICASGVGVSAGSGGAS